MRVAVLAFTAAGCNGLVGLDPTVLREPDAAGSQAWCAAACTDPAACLCADYDEETEYGDGWAFRGSGGGAGQRSVEDVQSPRYALLLSAPAAQLDGTGMPLDSWYAVVQGSLVTKRRHVVLDFEWKLFPYPRDTSGNFEMWSVALGSSARVAFGNDWTPDGNRWHVGNTTLLAAPGTYHTEVYPTVDPPTDADRWTHVILDVLFAPDATGSITLTFDGTEVFHRDAIQTASSTAPAGSATMSATLGPIWLQAETPPVRMLLDDVVLSTP